MLLSKIARSAVKVAGIWPPLQHCYCAFLFFFCCCCCCYCYCCCYFSCICLMMMMAVKVLKTLLSFLWYLNHNCRYYSCYRRQHYYYHHFLLLVFIMNGIIIVVVIIIVLLLLVSSLSLPSSSSPLFLISAVQCVQLLTNYDNNADAKYVLDNYLLVFLPMANPDGYEYSWTNDVSFIC